jgi:sarcosine oxidase subunit beta
MPWRLLRFATSKNHPEPRMFTRHDALKSAYDAVIIGGGGHGLAAAYYLARDHGVRDVARARTRSTSVAATPAATPPSSARTT